MKILSAFKYYLTSSVSLIFKINFIRLPIIKVNNLLFYVKNFMDIWTIKEVVIDRQYEIFRKIQSGDTVIDIGCGIGDFSIVAEKSGAKKIYGFDADQNRLNIANKNLILNRTKKAIIACKVVTDLDLIFNQYKLKHCHFLKIDTEGAEYKIIKNTSSSILNKIDYIAFEIHLFNQKMKEEYANLKAKLSSHKFYLLEKENPVHSYIKFLFASKKHF
jgi:SAM-dependent methyltransferase